MATNNIESLNELLSLFMIKRNDAMHNINALLNQSRTVVDLYDKLEKEIEKYIDYERKIEQVKAFLLQAQGAMLSEEMEQKDKKQK
jgi:predicted transcriptional regulator